MASFRKHRLAHAVRDIIGSAITREMGDPRISTLASVTRVELSADCLVAKVYISVIGSDADQRRTLAGLQHARGYFQRLVAKGLSVRQCPEVRFISDPSIKRTAEFDRLLEQSLQEDAEAAKARERAALADEERNDAGEDG